MQLLLLQLPSSMEAKRTFSKSKHELKKYIYVIRTIELVQGTNNPKEKTPRIIPPMEPKKLSEACKWITAIYFINLVLLLSDL